MADIDLVDDDIDGVWRSGLADLTIAADADPIARVEGRLRHRRRVRVVGRAIGAAALIALVIGVISYAGHPHRVSSASNPIVERVTVDDLGNQLRITFPGRRVTHNPPQIELRAGRVQFVVHIDGTHALRIDGVPGFDAQPPNPPPRSGRTTVVITVHLAQGRYVLHCIIPGHSGAGEVARLIVR